MTKSNIQKVFFGIPVIQTDAAYFKTTIIQNNPAIDHFGRWVQPGNFHITVWFIGYIESTEVINIINAIKTEINTMKSFIVNVIKLDHFPKPNSNIIAAYIEPCRPLLKLYTKIETVMTDLNYLAEDRKYQPHITLLRQKNKRSFHILPINLNNYQLPVNELILYKSEITKEGSIYHPLHRFKFRS